MMARAFSLFERFHSGGYQTWVTSRDGTQTARWPASLGASQAISWDGTRIAVRALDSKQNVLLFVRSVHGPANGALIPLTTYSPPETAGA